MQKYFYPIFKLPDEYEKDFRKYTLPLWVKWWLLGKSARELSQILTGSSFMLTNTVKRRFKKFEVGGNTEQTQYKGINLMPMNRPSFTVSDVTFTNNENSFILNGTKGVYFGERLTISTFRRLLKANTSYTLAIEVINGSATDLPSISNISVATPTDVNYKYTSIATLTSKGQKKTMKFVLTEDTLVNGFYIYYGVGNSVFTNYEIRVWLVEGDYTVETMPAYEPYCGGIESPNLEFRQPIRNAVGTIVNKVSNKNLAWSGWAEDFVTRVNNTSICTVAHNRYNRKNVLFYTPDVGYGDYDRKYIFKTDWKENTRYTFTFDYLKRLTTDKTFAIEYTDGSTTIIPNITNLEQWQHIVLVSDANKTIKYARVNNTGGVSYIDLDTFMVIEGAYTAETIPDYVPHEEQTAEFTLLEGQRLMLGDTLEDDGIHHKRKQFVFNGSENWSVANDYGFATKYTEESGYIAFSLSIYKTLNLKTSTTTNSISNIAKSKVWVDLQGTPQIGFCIVHYDNNYTTIWFAIPRSIADTVESWKAYLQENNVTVEGELLEEEIEPYTASQQEQYNEILNLKTYKDMTIIETSSDELPPILKIQYWKEKGTEDNFQINYVNPEENPNNIEFIEDDTLIPEDSINLDEIEKDKSFIDFLKEIGDIEESEINGESEENENESD